MRSASRPSSADDMSTVGANSRLAALVLGPVDRVRDRCTVLPKSPVAVSRTVIRLVG